MGDEEKNRDTGYVVQNERDMGYEGSCVTPPPHKKLKLFNKSCIVHCSYYTGCGPLPNQRPIFGRLIDANR